MRAVFRGALSLALNVAPLGCLFIFVLSVLQPGAAQSSAGSSRVECATLDSRILGINVPYCVMLPPSYARDKARRFPVTYYLHGLGDNEQSLVNLGGWAIYDRLMREKKIGEFVVIAPAGFDSFYINSQNGKLRYEDFFLQEFLPAMEKKYGVATEGSQRGIMGVSMGGFGALHYGFKYPQKFTAVSANMPALIERLPRQPLQETQQRLMSKIFGNPPDQAFFEKNSAFHLARVAPLGSLRRMTIYFDCGAQDHYGFYNGTAAMDKLLTGRGVAHESHIYPGGHDWQFVLEHFAASLEAQSKGLKAK